MAGGTFDDETSARLWRAFLWLRGNIVSDQGGIWGDILAAAAAIDGAYFGAQAAIMAASNGAEMQAALDALAGAFDA